MARISQVTERIGVPKHSELEPDYRLAERNGNVAPYCRLVVEKRASRPANPTSGVSQDGLEQGDAEHVSGQVYLDMPNITRDSEAKSPNVRARIGAGGTPIAISSVSGNVRLRRS